MASDASGSADSYIGSFISLTSKTDVHYEGVLFHINAEESIIGLKNVRSFGTEGQKREGLPTLPSDRNYESIFFRGTDIKDLQVLASPPVQSSSIIPDDPAIIQSHYIPPVTACTNLPPAGTGSVSYLSSNAQLGLPSSTFQSSLPSYQSVGNSGSWSSFSLPSASVSGPTIPTYWQGFNGPSGGVSNLQQQSMFRLVPGPMGLSYLQQQTQNPSMNASVRNSALNFHEFSHPLTAPVSASSLSSTSTSFPPPSFQLHYPMGHSTALDSNLLSNSLPNKAPASLPTVMLGSSLLSVPPLIPCGLNKNPIAPPSTEKPKPTAVPTLSCQTMFQFMPSVVGTSGSNHTEASVPFLVTPSQILQSNPSTLSSPLSLQSAHKDIEALSLQSAHKDIEALSLQSAHKDIEALSLQTAHKDIEALSLQTAHKDIEVVQASPQASLSSDLEVAQTTILPSQSPNAEKLNKAPIHTHHSDKGRERGRGNELNKAPIHIHHSDKWRERGRGNGLNKAPIHTHHSDKGRERGRGNELNKASIHTHHSDKGRERGIGNELNKASIHTHHSDKGRERGRGNESNKAPIHTHHSDKGHERGRGNELHKAPIHTHPSDKRRERGRGNELGHTHRTNAEHSRGRGNLLHAVSLQTHHSNRGPAQGRLNGLNGPVSNTHQSYRDRTRGRGNRISHQVTKFTEDFDFEGMNEKFNKDEVWGHLGKSNKARREDEKDALPKIEPVYVKDDFFDSLSRNLPDREPRRGKANFSERMKIDTETFGNFGRQRGGGRGSGQGRRLYSGRGYCYGHAGKGEGVDQVD